MGVSELDPLECFNAFRGIDAYLVALHAVSSGCQQEESQLGNFDERRLQITAP
ncbi:hypothetical protein [Streptomyces erythrochromogenes]|uniref:hypothetical protein n=1 Tax=Streptomyces erythrochromogenes TaxID=285574 RepID=UPI0036C98E18